MLSNLLHADSVWMPSVCYNPNYFLQNCVVLYLVPLLLNRIGYLLACVAALFVTSVCCLLSFGGLVDIRGFFAVGCRFESSFC